MPALILTVDDKEPIRELVSRIVLDQGYRTRVAIDGVGAISTVQMERPALVILDYLMPGMDGVEVCRILKRGRTTSQVKVIMLTAVSDEDTETKAAEGE